MKFEIKQNAILLPEYFLLPNGDILDVGNNRHIAGSAQFLIDDVEVSRSEFLAKYKRHLTKRSSDGAKSAPAKSSPKAVKRVQPRRR